MTSWLKQVENGIRPLMIGGILLFLIIFGPRLFAFYPGGWETHLEPVQATENTLQKTKSLTGLVDWTKGVDFDATFSGAPDVYLWMAGWSHTDGRLDPLTDAYRTTDWDEPAKSFSITYEEEITREDGTKQKATTTQTYDLHLFWTSVVIGTKASVKVVGQDHVGNNQFDHETSAGEVTSIGSITRNGDLGRPIDVSVQFKAALDIWDIRSQVDHFQKAGIMKIESVGHFYEGGQDLNTAKEEAAANPDYDYGGLVAKGTIKAKGSPQSGYVRMFWAQKNQAWQPRKVTSEGDAAQLPTALPEELSFNLNAELRAGYLLGKEPHTILHDPIKDLIPVNVYCRFGLLMEVLTVSEFTLYSDPYALPVTTPKDYSLPEPEPPGLWENLQKFFDELWPFGGLQGLIIFIVLAVVVITLGPTVIGGLLGRKMLD